MKKYVLLVLMFLIAAVSLAAADVMIDDNVKSEGYVGQNYEADIHVTCNDVPPDYSYGLDGNLPPGLKWNNKGGGWMTIYGNPTKAGKYKFKAWGSNWLGVGAEKTYTVEIKSSGSSGDDNGDDNPTGDKPKPSISAHYRIDYDDEYCLPMGAVGTYYSPCVIQIYHCYFYQYKVTGLPDGMRASGSIYEVIDGVQIKFEGTPTQVGTYEITVEATNAYGTDTKTYSLLIAENPTIEAKKNQIVGVAGKQYGYISTGEETLEELIERLKNELNGAASELTTLEAVGATPMTWQLIKGSLPTGISLDVNSLNSTLCNLKGKPATSGTYDFTIRVSNSEGYDDEDFTIVIGNDPIMARKVNGLKNGKVGEEYGIEFKAEGTKPMKWEIIDGSLPLGVKYEYYEYNKYNGNDLSASCYLSGKPLEGGAHTFTLRVSNSKGHCDETFTLTVEGDKNDEDPTPAPDPTPTPIPSDLTVSDTFKNGTTGIYYFDSVSVIGGKIPYTFSITDGNLPNGLELLSYSYLGKFGLSGTPTKEGEFSFTVRAEDSEGKTLEQKFTVKINSSTEYEPEPEPTPEEEKIPPEIKTETLTNAITGQTYSYQLTASGTAQITWTKSGTLPKGLTLNSSGLISGTPTKAGKSSFTVTAKNSYGKASRKFTINVLEPVSITTASLKAGTITKSYSVTLKAKGSKTITWSAEGLPNGLTMNEKGKISGKPTVYGNFTVKITAGNEAGSVVKTLPLEIKAIAPKLSGTLAKPSLNEPYSSALKVTGSEPVTWSITGTLPDGLTFDTSTGKISGTPTTYTKSGWKITITATNDAGKNSKNITLKVNATAPKITAKLPGAIAGENYSAKLTATGSEAITFTADLPEYLTLDGNVIAGNIPESIKSFKIKVYASNPVKTVSKIYTIKVSKKKKATPEILKAENDTGIMKNNTGINPEVIADMQINSESDADYSSEYVVAAELGEVSCDLPGMYDFNVELPDYIAEGSELVYVANSDRPSEDDDIAEFYDDAGNEISAVPENRRITISIWLNPETIYNPVISVKH